MSTVTRKDSPSTSSVTRSSSTGGSAPTEDAPSLDEMATPSPAEPAARFEGKAGADPQAAIRTIEGKLDGMHVSDAEARACVDELRDLTPADRALVWDAMGPESQARLLDNVDAAARSLLLDSLGDAGVLKQVGAAPHPNATTTSRRLVGKDAWGSPPEGPTLLARDPKMSPALQQAVHEENLTRAEQYRARYDEYLDAYKDEVVLPAAKKNDIASIRRAGPPGPLLLPEREPGAPLGAKGPGEVDRADAWRNVADPTQALVDVYGPITRAIHHARGEMMAGELRIGAEAAVKLGPFELAYGVDTGQDGDVNESLKAKVATGPGGVAIGDDGNVEGEVSLGSSRVGVGATLKPDGKGGEKVTEVSAKLGYAQVGADLEKGTAKVGVGVDGSLGSAKATAELKPFLGADEIGIFRKDDGFYDVPPELAKGIAWSDLPEARRQDLATTFGWGEKEWSELSQRHARLEMPTMLR